MGRERHRPLWDAGINRDVKTCKTPVRPAFRNLPCSSLLKGASGYTPVTTGAIPDSQTLSLAQTRPGLGAPLLPR